jgi:hypothetical protein
VEALHELIERLDRMEATLQILVDRQTAKEWYGTDDVARMVDRSEFTVREWCRLGRVRAEKRQSGRGPHAAWVISQAELARLQREGLLPLGAV